MFGKIRQEGGRICFEFKYFFCLFFANVGLKIDLIIIIPYVFEVSCFFFSALKVDFASMHFGDTSAFSIYLVLVSILSVSCTFLAATVQDQFESHQQMPSAQVHQVTHTVWHRQCLGQNSHFYACKTTKSPNKLTTKKNQTRTKAWNE